jgi:hypothetical protein
MVHFSKAMAMETIMNMSPRRKKKIVRGFPLFFPFKNFQTALLGDIKQWMSRQRQYRRHYRCRHRRSRSKCRKQNGSHGKIKIAKILRGESSRSIVCWLARSRRIKIVV